MGRFDQILAWFRGDPAEPEPDPPEYRERLSRITDRARAVAYVRESGRHVAAADALDHEQTARIYRFDRALVR
jgi:hypothetical protein